jgi:carboxyl-terminal processing protease
MKKAYFICVCLIFILSGCENILLNNNFKNTITGNYNAFWDEFDLEYGAFEAKHINWDSLKIACGKNLTDLSSEGELFDAISRLLSPLNDGHVDIYAPQFGLFSSWNRRKKSYYCDINAQSSVDKYRLAVIKNYLNNNAKLMTISRWINFYGVIDYRGKKIGYISIPTFESVGYSAEFVQTAVDTFNKLDGVVIDLRYNGGGDSETFVNCLNSFTSERKMIMKSKFRNGPSHSDFTATYEHWLNPHKNCLKNKPIVVLMNSFTGSSAEHFMMGMKTQSNVITVGDTTHGAFSMVRERILPNGWKYRICSQVIYNTDGSLLVDSKGNYLEGIGIAPDYYAPDNYNEALDGNDIPLNTALKKLFP